MKTMARLSLVAALLCGTAHADQTIEDGEKMELLFCDTQAQVTRLAEMIRDDKIEETIKTVNAELESPSACTSQAVVFYRGEKIGRVVEPGGVFDIIRVLVVGIKARQGILSVQPSVFFGMFRVDEGRA